ncbi:MAG: hypothetical protein U1E36_03925 [Rickettsiales bacterium]
MAAPIAYKYIPQGFGHVAKWVGAKDFGQKRIDNAVKRDTAFERWSDKTMQTSRGDSRAESIGGSIEGTAGSSDRMTGTQRGAASASMRQSPNIPVSGRKQRMHSASSIMCVHHRPSGGRCRHGAHAP